MASREFEELQARLAEAPQPPPGETLAEQRARIDATMGTLPLAAGVVANERDAAGVSVIDCRPGDLADGPTILYAHGGGFRLVSALAYRAYASHLAAVARGRVVVVDYRLAPEHPFPAALDDMLAAYRWLLADGVGADEIVVAGDSAGGNLAAAVALALSPSDPLPAGVVCCSPWVDLTNSAESFRTMADVDRLFSHDAAEEAAGLYLSGGADARNPLVSPVFGEWSGAPPMLIQVGGAEVLLDDAANLAERAEQAGVDVTHRLYPEMPHVFQISYPAFPEAIEAVEEIARFARSVTGRPD